MNPRLSQTLSKVFKIAPDKIDSETGPHNVPAWDSAGHINLILELEKEFGVKFEDEEVVELISAGAISEALARRGVAA